MKTENFKRNFLILGAASASIGYIFSIASGSIGFIIFLFSWLLNHKENNFYNIFKIKIIHLLILFFLFICVGAHWSVNIQQGQKEIIRFLPFLLIPIVFTSIKNFEKRERLFIIKIFVNSLTIFFLACFVTAIIRQIDFWGRGGIFNWYYFYRHDFLEVFDQHPTYLSMFTLLSLTFLFYEKKNIIKRKWIFNVTIALQIVAIILYGSRIGYILFLVLSIIYIVKDIYLISYRERIIKILIYLVGVSFLFVIVWNIPIIKERILYTFGYSYDYKFNDAEFIKNSNNSEENGRLLLWRDAWELIEQRPLLGYGTGSSREVLIEKYKENGHTLFLENRYNAHNTYLELLLQGGVLLLIMYIILFISLFWRSYCKKNLLLFSFALIITVISLTETIFISQGIFFLSFFYCFLYSNLNE